MPWRLREKKSRGRQGPVLPGDAPRSQGVTAAAARPHPALRRLRPASRERRYQVIMLRYFAGLTGDRVAKTLGGESPPARYSHTRHEPVASTYIARRALAAEWATTASQRRSLLFAHHAKATPARMPTNGIP